MNEKLELLKIAAQLTSNVARQDNLTLADCLKLFDACYAHIENKLKNETNQSEKPTA